MAFSGHGCRIHHLLWFTPARDVPTRVAIGCAHCSFVHSRLDLDATYPDDVAERAVRSSRDAHARLCDRSRDRRSRSAQ